MKGVPMIIILDLKPEQVVLFRRIITHPVIEATFEPSLLQTIEQAIQDAESDENDTSL